MAKLTITNLTTEPILLQELYTTLGAGESMETTRYRDDLHSHPRIQQLWEDGKISVTVASETAEDDFIDEKLHLFGGVPVTELTRTYHEPTITPGAGTNAPGQQPDLGIIGSTLVAEFTINTDAVYRVFKIPTNYVGDAAFHVHWTKESGVAGDSDQSGNAVLWRISYTVFSGGSPAGASGGDVNTTPSVLEYEDIYDDSGTTTRLIYRTPNLAASGFVAGYYVGVMLEAATPSGAALTCEPAMVTVDLTFTQYINQ